MPDTPVCQQCGQSHVTRTGLQACTGHKSGWLDDQGERHLYKAGDWKPPCTKPPMRGQQVCEVHGGRSRQARASAEIRRREMEAKKTLAEYLIEGDDRDPALILLERISVASCMTRFYTQQVHTLSDQEHIWGRTKEISGGKDAGTTYEAAPHAWVVLMDRWENTLARLCVDALKVGLKQRELDIAQEQGDRIVALLEGIVTDLGHDPADPAISGIIVRHLRLISAS